MRVWFDHADGLRTRPGDFSGPAGSWLGEFEVAGADRHFHRATAVHIDGTTIVVCATDVHQSTYVRYAWPNAPAAYLENSAGLPASTFTSEEQLTSPCPAAFPSGCPQVALTPAPQAPAAGAPFLEAHAFSLFRSREQSIRNKLFGIPVNL